MRPSFPITDWTLRLLKRICPDDLYEMIEGDLIEQFEDNIEEFGRAKARRIFAWNTMRFVGVYFLKRKGRNQNVQSSMILHYLISSYRHMSRTRILSLINIIGLAVAFITFFLIARYISFET